jgi:hypothetical protein
MFALNNLANYIQTELNNIATEMYDNSDILEKVVFFVTDSEQSYDDAYTNMEYALNDEIKYTPVLLKRIFATKQDDYVYGKFIETYRMEVLSFMDNKTSVELVFNRFTEEQNIGDYQTLADGTQVKKNHSQLAFFSLINAKSGTNKHFISYTYEFTWDYVIGSIISDASSLDVDGVTLDFLGIAFQNDKIAIANVPYGTNVLPSTNGMTYSITFPILKGDSAGALKNQELFDDITLNRYNKTHTLEWVLDDYKTVSLTGMVRSGSVIYNRDELVSFVVVFEQALPRTTVQLNSTTLPVLTFNLQRENNVESIVKTDSVESVAVSTGYNIIMRVAHDHSNALSRTLLSQVMSGVIGTEYTISVLVGTQNQITFSDTVILKGGTYQFEQTGELIYEVTFVKVV